MTPNERLTLAESLRAEGKTYAEIGQLIGLTQPQTWTILNRKRHNQNTRESQKRYVANGKVPLCTLPENPSC